ncbi:ECF RNA polymerase sigma factor SigH [subsurface metagenome]
MDRILEAEEIDEIQNLLQKLPPKLKIVTVLNDIYNFKYKEISKILNIPLGTVKSRVSRSREILRNFLKQKENKK